MGYSDVAFPEGTRFLVTGGAGFMGSNLCEALGVDVEPIFGPPRAGDIRHSNADISKARELLGYDPSWSFARGIKAAIAWYRENL
ncbi:MAG: hypothetical protein IKG22_13935 [Atopobiaceae bacterium]|nr:hypothetical protein [Atopobiaceae bacterium]